MKIFNNLPELAVHQFKINFATGNFSLNITDYAQQDILKIFSLQRQYNSREGFWKFNLDDRKKILTLSTLKKIFFVREGENLISFKDELGRTTKYFYEENLLTRVNYPDGSNIFYFYDENNLLKKVVGRDGKIIFQNEYDELGRITKLNDRNFFYDDQNWQTIENKNIFYIRNRKRLITKIIFPDCSEENFDYDEQKNLIHKVNRNGEENFWTYDGDKLMQKIFPNGLTKNFEYDERGNLIKIFDSEGREEIFKYSTKNFLVMKSFKLNVKDWRQEFFERDILGRILIHDVNGNVKNFSYDENSPLPSLEKTPCGYKISYRYDNAYRILAIRTETGEFFFSQSPMNEIIGDTKIFSEIFRPEKNFSKSDVEIFDFGGRLIEARNKIGEKFKLTRWKYDLNDNCIERRDWKDLQDLNSATGRVEIKKFFYDEQNRLTKKIEKDLITKFQYDCLNHEVRKWQTKINL